MMKDSTLVSEILLATNTLVNVTVKHYDMSSEPVNCVPMCVVDQQPENALRINLTV
jgi:hypothetical protein